MRQSLRHPRILFVCPGNICRSPMAEFVLKKKLEEEELAACVASAATRSDEIGSPVHRGTQKILNQLGIDYSRKRAVRVTREDYDRYDLIVGMDDYNIRDLLRLFGGDPEGKVIKLMSLVGSGRDVADPWYTGDFDLTFRDVDAGCNVIVDMIKKGNL